MSIIFDENFIKNHKRKTNTGSAILYFMSYSNGKINWQGTIDILRSDGSGLATTFDWISGGFMGEREIRFTKAFLPECIFFSTDQEMKDWYADWEKQN